MKKTLKIVGIIAIAAVIGFAFAACEGPAGPAGPQGDRGDQGEQGTPGTGTSVTIYVNDDGYWVINGEITTVQAQGEQGPAGPQGDQGEPGQPGTPGAPVTIYINEYGYWVINGVVTTVQAQGVQGPPGQQGAPGEQGPPGQQGTPGEQGPPGQQGAPGEQGPPGQQGAPGEQGPPGDHTPGLVTGMQINTTRVYLMGGEYYVLTATITPSDAIVQTVLWKTTDTNIGIAIAEPNSARFGILTGPSIVVSARAQGYATITATAMGSGATHISETITVRVMSLLSTPSVFRTSIDEFVWAPVSNAIGYEVRVYAENGAEFIASSREMTFDPSWSAYRFYLPTLDIPFGAYIVRVIALGEGVWANSHPWQGTWEFSPLWLTTPTLAFDVDGTLRIAHVANAGVYRVYVDGVARPEVIVPPGTAVGGIITVAGLFDLANIDWVYLNNAIAVFPVEVVAVPANPERFLNSLAARSSFIVDNPAIESVVIPSARFAAVPGLRPRAGTFQLVMLGGEFSHIRITDRVADNNSLEINFADLVDLGYISLPGTYTVRMIGRPGFTSAGGSAFGGIRMMGMPGWNWGQNFPWTTGENFDHAFRTFELPDIDLREQLPPNVWSGVILSSDNSGQSVDILLDDVLILRGDETSTTVAWSLVRDSQILGLLVPPTGVEITTPAVDGAGIVEQGGTLLFTAEVSPAETAPRVNWSITPPVDGASIRDDGMLMVGPLVFPSPLTVMATVPGIPEMTATRTVTVTAAEGLVTSAPSRNFMANTQGTVTVEVSGGHLGAAGIVSFADAVSGLPTGITASGDFVINAAGEGGATLTLQGIAAEADVGDHTITVTIRGVATTFTLRVVYDAFQRLSDMPGNLDAIRTANIGNIAFDMQDFDTDQAVAHFGGGIGDNRGEVFARVVNGQVAAFVTNFYGAGANDPNGASWTPLMFLAANTPGINEGYVLHITGRMGPDGFVFEGSAWQGLRQGVGGTAVPDLGRDQEDNIRIQPGPFAISHILTEANIAAQLSIGWNSWSDFGSALTAGTNPLLIAVDDMVIVRSGGGN